MGTRHVAALTLLVLTGCASVEELTGNNPIVDTRGVDMTTYTRDLSECQAYADEVQIAEKAASGAVTGAVVGAAVGAAIGNSDTAKRGAGVGAVAGGARGIGEGIRERDTVIKRCLIGRGYRVLN